MKKNKIFTLGLIVTFVALISLSLVSSTWAKYTSSVSGTSKATVAKWSFNFNGESLPAETIQFNLFKTIYDTNTSSEGKETDVKEGLIAPGTKGGAVLKFTNTGQVNAKAIVTLELNNSTIPLTFSLNGTSISLTNGTYTLPEANGIALPMATNEETTEVEINLDWMWAFDGDDTTDTNLGTAETTPEVIVKLTVEFVQVD